MGSSLSLLLYGRRLVPSHIILATTRTNTRSRNKLIFYGQQVVQAADRGSGKGHHARSCVDTQAPSCHMAPGLNRGVRICLDHTHRPPKIHPPRGRGGHHCWHWAPKAISYFSHPLRCTSFLRVVWSGLGISCISFLLDGPG